MIVCVCKAVSDRRIRSSIAEGNHSVEELEFELGVTGCCGKCKDTVQALIVESRRAVIHVAPISFVEAGTVSAPCRVAA
ncbi:(2Fe-2S)-binding protein [Chitinasiproducens palmae]|uniref:(2Fe-2S)-binding protein n=1 Tax=Chitinasiproducens palmae TaxID=1770053 RepID=UPI000B837EFE|nr:(2Fe-2S)-binding protein [Chitinasiproducens palmae]